MGERLNIALAGNPNSGKSSLFNLLTGLRQKVGNYPGVTIDRKTGNLNLGRNKTAKIIDLPGAYSLYPGSDDERIAARILWDTAHPDHPDRVVFVADATNLKRSLLLCTQIRDLGLPVSLVLNMADLLEKSGTQIDIEALSRALSLPVLPLSALRGKGIGALKQHLKEESQKPRGTFFRIPASFSEVLETVKKRAAISSDYLAFQVLLKPEEFSWLPDTSAAELQTQAGIKDPDGLLANEITLRYDRIQEILDEVTKEAGTGPSPITKRLDKVLLHPVGGYVIFLGLLVLIFQAIFSWATLPMDAIDNLFSQTGAWLSTTLPEHFMTDLLVNGIWAGLGGIVIFIPQIALLFLFITILEDSGYMSRAVFLMDRIMRPFGFSGKSVIPLIGGMACAVPSIMMARTIPNKVERMITIMVTPLMSCSARIPVYILLISMFVPDDPVLGIFTLQGLTMTGMYFLGFFMALAVAFVLKRIYRYRSDAMFITELPVYRAPRWNNALSNMYHKSKTFVVEAGKIIIMISIVLWALSSYGPPEKREAIKLEYSGLIEQAGENETQVRQLETQQQALLLQNSYAGMLGKWIEPVIKPLGFDWKIGISLITSFAAREVFVGTMATLYAAGEDAADEQESRFGKLRQKMLDETYPGTTRPVYTPAVAFALLVFYAFAMQCMSTLAVTRKETRSWRITIFMLLYMTGLAYVAALLVFQIFGP